jgi:thiol-disulfide isomerase/thioredoxin
MKRNITVLLLCSLLMRCAIAGDAPAKQISNSAKEQELVGLVNDLQTKIDEYHEAGSKIADDAERTKFYLQTDFAREAVPKLLAFEEKQRGTGTGLMALGVIVNLGAASETEDALYLGRREALKRLPAYANRLELADILRYAASGRFDPSVRQLFSTLKQSKDADPTIREFSQLMLARWMLETKHGREIYEQHLRELDKGTEPLYPTQRQFLTMRLATVPTMDQMQGWEEEAVGVLKKISESAAEHRQPAVVRAGPRYCLIRFDAERTKTMPRLSEIAEGMLFKEEHLQLGRPAPELKVRLVSGKDWELSAQRGKPVIIQFSFKGCGPCEEMYPDLREIEKEYGPRISILSILGDEQQSDTEEAVKLGKLTWNIHWDGGSRGPITTRWAVTYFPTIYVVDAKGSVVARDLRGKQLKGKVAELVKLSEPPKEPQR